MAMRFLCEFLRNPVATAAVAPSSQALARRMLEGVDLARARTVVEYGPGTGVFSRAVCRALQAAGNTEARFVALELNARMAAALRSDLPRAEVHHANADDVEQILGSGPGSVDFILSGLGWPSLPAGLRRRLLERTHRLLKPGGEFRTFGYHIGLTMAGAWDFRRTVRGLFDEVSISPVVWGNIPPAFVYRCRKVGPSHPTGEQTSGRPG